MKEQKTVTPLKARVTKKQKDPQYKVLPFGSLRGRDIMSRLKNKSLIITPSDNYSLEGTYDEIRRMDKRDIINAARNNTIQINSLKQKLQNGN